MDGMGEFAVKKPVDLATINAGNINELLWWSYNMGICPERLLSIIRDYGSRIADIEKHTKPNGEAH